MCTADADLPVVPKLKDQFAIIEEAHCGKGPLTEATEQEAAANIGSHLAGIKLHHSSPTHSTSRICMQKWPVCVARAWCVNAQ